jgi:glycosyltransferase involved in cell wall biosynthesis
VSHPVAVAMLSHLASRHAPTGAERSLALLACGLVERGHRVAVVAPGPWALADELRASGVEIHEARSRPCWLTYWEHRPWPVALAKYLRFAWPSGARARLGRLLLAFRPDVVHVNCLPHLDGAIAGRRSGRPVVWHIREILPEGGRRRWWAGHLARNTDSVVAVSEATAAWLRAEGLGARVTVVHNGIAAPATLPNAVASRRALGVPAEGVWIGLIGQLLEHKGVLAFVAAAARAAEQDPDVRFLVVGKGPPTFVGRLRQAIASTPTPERFLLLPAQSSAETVIAACDAVCVPTLTPDPLPRAVLEAMALGRPVIGSALGGIPEMVVDGVTGLLVSAGDENALTAALTRIATEPTTRWRLGEAGRERARSVFPIERHIEQMAGLLTRST